MGAQDSGQAGALSHCAIEVTSEMIDAGVRELLFWHGDVVSESGRLSNEQVVIAVFSSMAKCSPLPS